MISTGYPTVLVVASCCCGFCAPASCWLNHPLGGTLLDSFALLWEGTKKGRQSRLKCTSR
jgi:hypothetical protein